jgi:anti-anti-sigma factor
MTGDDFWQVVVDDPGDGAVVRATGELDLACRDALGAALEAARRHGHDLVVDLSGVGFLDSSALHVLLEALAVQRSAGQDLVLRAPSLTVREVLEIAGLDTVLVVEEVPDEAQA